MTEHISAITSFSNNNSFTKKQLREAKLAKKNLRERSAEDRKKEIDVVLAKFTSLGISEEIEEVSQFFQIARTFIETGIGSSGKIMVPAINRVIQYLLSNNKMHELQVILKNV